MGAEADDKAVEEAPTEEELERQIQEALSCPCVDHIKSGPCGSSFVQAFSCYLKGQAKPQGDDCLEQYREMQKCMSQHPAAFSDLAETLEEVTQHVAPAATQ